MMQNFKRWILGEPKNALNVGAQKHIALIALLAWVGLGADGLSSSCYGPEQAFIALGQYHQLALYLAIATSITVFLIALAYNQVIELFPNGGGGYKVATHLLGPYAGLVSGCALIIDYMLTIAVSIASGIDTIFSFLPTTWEHHKVLCEVLVISFLMLLNLRGVKESIKVLLPIFIAFVVLHVAIIIVGVAMHGAALPGMLHGAIQETHIAAHNLGFFVVLALFLRAYSLGAGTYTGLEAVSNNVHVLKEPRVQTGRLTMLYMAISLSAVAGGIILLYLLWHVTPQTGMTLNAVVFNEILQHFTFGHPLLVLILLSEAGLLFVGGNTGFLAGPAVLANMSLDEWVPSRFSALSSRLVTQNGIIFYGIAALIVILWSGGEVATLVVLYSINVFITFSLSILGLIVYWLKHKKAHWLKNLILAVIAFIICISMLFITIISKFELGGWVTLVVTLLSILIGIIIRKHYKIYQKRKVALDKELNIPITDIPKEKPVFNPTKPTAIFLVKHLGAAMHTILWVERMFPNHFKNFIFISHGSVDIGSFGSEKALARLQKQTKSVLDYLTGFAQSLGIAAQSYTAFGTDPVNDIMQLATKFTEQYPDAIYFASSYCYQRESWLTRILHSDVATLIQRKLHQLGAKMLIVPLNLAV